MMYVVAHSYSAETRKITADTVVMAFTNLPDPGLNGGLVVALPRDPAATIRAAEAAAVERGQPLGMEVERDRYPEMEEALVAAGLARLFSHPAMTVEPELMSLAA